MEKGDIRQIGFDKSGDMPNTGYKDDDIAFHHEFNELPIENGALKVDMYVIIACIRGKMQAEINTKAYAISPNHVIIGCPNDLINNCMLSPDFKGIILCLSRRFVMECFSESDFWNRAFCFAENPIIHIDEDSLKTFNLYGEMLKEKTETERPIFRKEIIISVARAAIYELLSHVSTHTSFGNGLVRQREVLFKRFIELLTGNRIKPRSVTWYAECLCVTPKHLSTVCKQVSGRTAFDWINEYVQIDIRHFLKNSSRSIKEVADMLNFPNLSFFGKYCRQHFGASPTELRKQLREQA